MSERKRVGIICAMQSEIDELQKVMSSQTHYPGDAGMDFVCGCLEGRDVVTAVSGEGKVAAAICTWALIDRFSVDSIIDLGVAGSLRDELGLGDIVIASDVVQHDMDVSGLGYPPGQIPSLDVLKIPCDETMRDALFAEAKRAGNCMVGTIASGDLFVHEEKQKQRIRNQFDAAAAEMEGAAVGQVCYMRRIPFAVMRIISDDASDLAPESYQKFEKDAAKRGCEIVRRYMQRETV